MKEKETMLKKALTILSLLLLTAGFICAQEFGAIRGKVTDKDGNALPGVNITLTGSKTAPRSLVSSAEGNFRFLNLPVAGDYSVVFEIAGFKTLTRQGIAVSYGRDVSLDIALDQAAIEEQVTVVGQTPVIDTKRTQVGVNITSEMIMRLPTARDPWVMMQLSPGMMIDRENVGGSDSGQQSGYYGHGSSSGDATWNIDGANITDNSALGAAPGYLNMAGFEEILINYGNNDVRSQTGGVQLNFITKRGGNAFSGMAYIDASKGAWQSTNLPEGLPSTYTGAGINKIYLYGANFGGPILKDKLWFYGSYGIQDLGTFGITGVADNTWLESGYFRLDAQLAKNTRLNAFYEYDNKQKWGRTNWSAAEQGPETVWNQVGPTPIYKVEIEQMFGNLFFNAKVAYTHNTFHLIPKLGPRTTDGSGPYQTQTYQPEFYASGNISDYNTVRPQTNASFTGNFFAENVLGADHEFKFGVDYVHSGVSSYSIYEGNLIVARWPEDDWYEAWIIRDYYNNYTFDRYSAFAQDTLSFGRLAMTLGLRYDIEKSIVANVHQPAVPFANLAYYLCDLAIDKFDPGIGSKVFSPRLSLVYDISGDGKNVLKLNLARYGSQTGYDYANFLNPVPWAEIDIRWVDGAGGGLLDGRVTENELVGINGGGSMDVDGWSWFGGFDPADPTVAQSTNKFDPNYKTPLLDELSVSFEREIISDFAIRLEGFYKNRHRYAFNRGILGDGLLETKANYYVATEPVSGADYYLRNEWAIGSYRTNYFDGVLQSDGTVDGTIKNKEHERYMAAEIVLKKRLSHNWMLDGSFTLSNWKYFHGNSASEWYDLTNYDFYEGGVVAPRSGGSGISNVWVNARWMVKLAGLYQFPYGLSGSFAFQAREGYVYPPFVQIYRNNFGWTNIYSNQVGEVGTFGDQRLPNFFELSLRLEKTFNVTEKLRFTVAADCFNVFNSATTLERQARLTSSRLGMTQRILNPRVFRAGVRVEF
jgi:hypothetical protein